MFELQRGFIIFVRIDQPHTMRPFEKISKKNIASDKLIPQIFGALLQWRTRAFLAFVFLVIPLSVLAANKLVPDPCIKHPFNVYCWSLLGLNLVVWLVIKVCRTLTNIFTLNRNDNGVTSCQIIILATMGVWLVGFVLIFDLQVDSKVVAAIGIIGVVLSWIFQDRVKSVIAFIHLRRHHLLNIGDWIKVPNLGVDGEVKKVTLTTVTLYNWDTTTSTIPISALQSGHFINLQKMADGKTYGRKMQKDFTLDTSWIRPITDDDVELLSSADHGIKTYLPDDEIKKGVLNAHLYRIYLYHWLMNHPSISHQPRLIVRWLDQKDSGLVLQVYAFIVDSNFATFEWQQSQIIEHIITSMDWFGLRLYQSPSAYDVSNSNIHIENPEVILKEDNHGKE